MMLNLGGDFFRRGVAGDLFRFEVEAGARAVLVLNFFVVVRGGVEEDCLVLDGGQVEEAVPDHEGGDEKRDK